MPRVKKVEYFRTMDSLDVCTMKTCSKCLELPTLVSRKSMLWTIYTYQCPCGKDSISTAFKNQGGEDWAKKSAADIWDVVADQ